MNPKDLVGAKKAPLRYVPPALYIGASEAMETGALKYGPMNWREQPVSAVTYAEAMLRHIFAWLDGQDYAEDSGIHHLKHVAAGDGILLDAMENGTLLDDRFHAGPAAKILAKLDKSTQVPTLAEGIQALIELPDALAATPPIFAVKRTKFLCGHFYGEEPLTDEANGPVCGSAVHWTRVNGIERQPEFDGDLIAICEDSGNHMGGRHLLSCPEFS